MIFSFVESAQAAAATPILDPTKTYYPSDIILIGVSLVVLVAGLCAVLFIIWGGVMLILSGGKDEKVKPAMNSIRYSVIGIILIIVTIFVAPTVGNLLGLNIGQYIAPDKIFGTIKILSNRIFANGVSPLPLSPENTVRDANFSDL